MKVIFPFISFLTSNEQHPKPGPKRRPRNRANLRPTSLNFPFGKGGHGVVLALCALIPSLALVGCSPGNVVGTSSVGWSPVATSESLVYVATRQGDVTADRKSTRLNSSH